VSEPPYEQEHIRRPVGTEVPVGEPELSVEVVAGRVLVTGSVPSERVREAIDIVVAEVAPDVAVDNRVTVAPADEPSGEETIP
jgi:osmotically-inducible protein OsmY